MKHHQITLVCFLLFLATTAFAANSVVVESKSVALDTTGNTVGVYITNDVAIEGAVFPLEIRTVAGPGFITGTLSATNQNRLSGMTYPVTAILPEKDNTIWYKCDGTGYKTRGAGDFVSPEGLFFGAINGVGVNPIGTGTDASGQPSLLITFNTSNQPGIFIIDTTCVTPDNHLAFFGSTRELITPSFTPGRISICSTCPCWADPQCDGVRSNALDIVVTVNVAFRGVAATRDTNCPVDRTDVNADGVTNAVDMVIVVNVAFRGAAPTQYVNPCP